MALTEISEFAKIIGVIIGFLLGVKALMEFVQHSRKQRAEFFFKLSERLSENNEYIKILELLEIDDPKLAAVELSKRRELMGLLEEASILLNSGLVNESVALHFFGYYAIDCWESEHIWIGLNREEHWKVLGDFVNRMKIVEQKLFDRKNY